MIQLVDLLRGFLSEGRNLVWIEPDYFSLKMKPNYEDELLLI